MKKKLLVMLKTKEEARTALVTKSEASTDVAELRSINTQIQGLNDEIVNIRNLIDYGYGGDQEPVIDEEEKRTKIVNQDNDPEQRSFQPGNGFKKVEGANFEEKRTKEELNLAEREKRGQDLKESRSVTVTSSSILLADVASSTINPTFNVVSGLIDRVDLLTLTGGESFTQPFEIDTSAGDYTAEEGVYTTADTTFGQAAINKSKVTAYSETTEEVSKLPAAPYENVIMSGITKSVRRKITKEILVGTGATNHLSGIFSTTANAILSSTDLGVSAISNTTLNDIIFSYGGDEEVEDQAVLILNKVDLKAFSQLRTTDGSKFHTIVSNGNTGTIDGIPYIINSACLAISATATATGAYAMAYGPLSNYKLVIFSDLDVQRSTEFKFSTGQIAHRGSIFIGGNVVAQNGFLRVTKAAAV